MIAMITMITMITKLTTIVVIAVSNSFVSIERNNRLMELSKNFTINFIVMPNCLVCQEHLC